MKSCLFSVQPERAVTALDRFSRLRVLVVGDLMVDEYLWGRVERISPEAPVQVVTVDSQEYRLGGCGNVVNNLRSLGASVSVSGVVGYGRQSRFLYDQFQRLDVDTEGLAADRKRPTTKKTRVIAANQQVVRIDVESREPIGKRLETQIAGYLERCASRFDVVLISDYGKGMVTNSVSATAIENAKKHAIPIIVDPKGKRFDKYARATVITPNCHEAEIATHIEIKDNSDAEKAARKIITRTKCGAVLLKRGEWGMSLITASGSGAMHIPAHTLEVFDVTGAGDTVSSVLGLGMGAGLSIEEASILANLAGGIVVGKLGTSVVSREEILNAVNTRQSAHGLKNGKRRREAENLVPAGTGDNRASLSQDAPVLSRYPMSRAYSRMCISRAKMDARERLIAPSNRGS